MYDVEQRLFDGRLGSVDGKLTSALVNQIATCVVNVSCLVHLSQCNAISLAAGAFMQKSHLFKKVSFVTLHYN